MKSNKKIFVFLFSLIFLFSIISFVSSVPPVTNVQQFTEGYVLKFPSDQIIKQNMSYEFEFHVFNISNGYPITTGLSCYFHLYNSTGKHQLELTDVSVGHNFDYSFNVDGGNFTKVGDYYYITQCNSTTKGGYIEVPFEVTPNGLEVTTGRAIIDLGVLFLLLSFLVLTLFLIVKVDNLLVKVGMFGLNYLLLISITFIAWNMASDFLLSAPFVAEMFRIMFFVLIIGLFPLIIGAFAWYVLMMFKIKEIENLVNHGMSEAEAEHRVKNKRKFRHG